MNLTIFPVARESYLTSVVNDNQHKYFACARLLKQQYATQIATPLIYHSPYQLLIATILCVQSDEGIVNRVTEQLFAKYPDPQAMISADIRDIKSIIRPTKFHRRKAKHLQLASEMFLLEYRGKIPTELIELTKLPGISRRSAYLILSELYGKTEGIIVDSRVWRVAQRLGLAKGHSAESIETQLIRFVPHSEWKTLHALFTQHADALCTVQSPNCIICPLMSMCDSSHV